MLPNFAPQTTALIVIDLQHGIVARDTAPHAAKDVVARVARLSSRMRDAGATIVFVRVAFSADDRDRLKAHADQPAPASVADLPPEWSQLVPELGVQPSDLVITKRQWGAFYGTELDLQLRRRGIRTIVLTGISTNFGVESTGRDAWERGYEQIFVEDAMSGLSGGAHEFAITTIFPRLGVIVSTEEVLAWDDGRPPAAGAIGPGPN
ncbi:MAG TPA: hydrolase [Thermoanaerobaculia bacterium]|nr:hydrolase [Thermoanaerobaculia bacterium]